RAARVPLRLAAQRPCVCAALDERQGATMNRTIPLLFLFFATTLAPAAAPPNLPPVWRMLSDSDHRKVVQWQKQSATSMSSGDTAKAIKLSRQVYELRKAKQGADHWQTIDALWELNTLVTLSKLEATERAAFLKTLQDTPTIHEFAQLGKNDEAISLARTHLARYEKALGKGHPICAVAALRIADLLEAQGRYFDSTPYFEAALRINQKHLGSDHPYTAGAKSRMAQNLQHRGDYASARPLHEQTLTAA